MYNKRSWKSKNQRKKHPPPRHFFLIFLKVFIVRGVLLTTFSFGGNLAEEHKKDWLFINPQWTEILIA